MKQKLETLCRELDKQIKALDEEVSLLRTSEQKVRADMKERFEKNFQGIKDKIELEGYGENTNEDSAYEDIFFYTLQARGAVLNIKDETRGKS